MIYQLNLTIRKSRSVSDFSHNLSFSLIVFFYFHSFKLYFINESEFRLLSLQHNAQLSLIRVSDNRWVGCFNHSKKTGAKTRPCFTGFEHPLHVIRLDFLHKALVSFLVLAYDLFKRYFSQ